MKIKWDRLMETCVKRRYDAMLVEGTPGFVRGELGLQNFAAARLAGGDLESMASELTPADAEKIAGYTTFDVNYGEEFKFRLTVLGKPAASIFVTRIAPDMPSWEGLRMQWAVPQGATSVLLDRVLANCAMGYVRDAVLVPGYPPLAWTRYGIHASVVPPLDAATWNSMMTEARRRAPGCHQGDGWESFYYQLEGSADFDVTQFMVTLIEPARIGVFSKLPPEGHEKGIPGVVKGRG